MNSLLSAPVIALCALYVLAKVTRGAFQWHTAEFTQASQESDAGRAEQPWPSVDVLVPCYNEDPVLLDACLASLAAQEYRGTFRVIVVDDGSRNQAALIPVVERHLRRPGWEVVLLAKNMGKRRALDVPLWTADSELVVTLDSDTELPEHALRRIVAPFADDNVGVVSGRLRARNASTNLLTSLINVDYTRMFDRERAAQGRYQTLLCCCGGFAAYRRTALAEVWEGHMEQTFGGKPCTTGDDLHLTLELLARGYDAVLRQDAVASTHVPDTLRRYARQQRRWSRSFIRELPLAVRAVVRRPGWGYLLFDLAVQLLAPVLLGVAAGLVVVQGVLGGLAGLVGGLGVLGVTMLATSVLAAVRAEDPSYVLYGAVYHFVVVPGFLVSLLSVGRDSWATRELPEAGARAVPRQVPQGVGPG